MNWFSDIPVYEWKDLDGKTLYIRVEESEEAQVLAGYDPVDDKIYILAEKFNKGVD